MSEISQTGSAGTSHPETRADECNHLVELFAHAMEENGGIVTLCRDEHSAAAGVARLVRDDGVVLVDSTLPGLAGALREQGIDAGEVTGGLVAGLAEIPEPGRGKPGPGPSVELLGVVLPQAGAAVTNAIAAVAETGTVIVGPGTGSEGLLSVLAPHHVVVLRASAIETDLATVLTKVAPMAAKAGNRLVFVSGPSRTADIELTTVMGAHGPLRMDVVVVTGGSGSQDVGTP
jgi:hypothetical protein